VTDPDQERWRVLTALLEPIHPSAQATAHRLTGGPPDGDDLYHEAVLRAFDKLHTLRDATRFRSWFFAVLLSVHRTRHRRAFWKRFLSLDAPEGTHRDPVGDDGAGSERDRARARRLQCALERLPAVQREAVILFEVEGFGIEEIASMQRVSASAVKSRLARGRKRLREFYRRRGWTGGAGDGTIPSRERAPGKKDPVEQVTT
jgi:RNA polymerase sigma-70 factor (ECF subfamily)